MSTGTGLAVGVLFLSAVAMRTVGLMASSQKGRTIMKQTGTRNWSEKMTEALTETLWALTVGFEASVLAA